MHQIGGCLSPRTHSCGVLVYTAQAGVYHLSVLILLAVQAANVCFLTANLVPLRCGVRAASFSQPDFQADIHVHDHVVQAFFVMIESLNVNISK